MDIQKLRTELQFKATRSSGNGGQNVNKVSTKVELLFDVNASKFLDETEKQIILNKLANLISQRGTLRVVCQSTRSQFKNRIFATEKFQNLIISALVEPKERKKVKIPASVIKKRREDKRRNSQRKQNRKKVNLSKINLFFIAQS